LFTVFLGQRSQKPSIIGNVSCFFLQVSIALDSYFPPALLLFRRPWLLSADETLCLFNAASVIVKGSLVSIMSLSSYVHFYDFPAFDLHWSTVEFQTATPPTPVTRG